MRAIPEVNPDEFPESPEELLEEMSNLMIGLAGDMTLPEHIRKVLWDKGWMIDLYLTGVADL